MKYTTYSYFDIRSIRVVSVFDLLYKFNMRNRDVIVSLGEFSHLHIVRNTYVTLLECSIAGSFHAFIDR